MGHFNIFQLPASNWTQRPDLEIRMCHLLTTERVAGINFCWLLHDFCGFCGVKSESKEISGFGWWGVYDHFPYTSGLYLH